MTDHDAAGADIPDDDFERDREPEGSDLEWLLQLERDALIELGEED